jgi:hypothetical protein
LVPGVLQFAIEHRALIGFGARDALGGFERGFDGVRRDCLDDGSRHRLIDAHTPDTDAGGHAGMCTIPWALISMGRPDRMP